MACAIRSLSKCICFVFRVMPHVMPLILSARQDALIWPEIVLGASKRTRKQLRCVVCIQHFNPVYAGSIDFSSIYIFSLDIRWRTAYQNSRSSANDSHILSLAMRTRCQCPYIPGLSSPCLRWSLLLLALWLVQVQAMKDYEIRDLRYVDSEHLQTGKKHSFG